MRNLTKTLAAMSLLAPMTVHSLGIGDIQLHSALNQKLNAEIALSLMSDEDIADVKVSLAPPAKFDQAGVAWTYFVSKIKFQPKQKKNGQYIVKVTSNEVVQEPFLDFLIEVSWPKGEVLKEFTVLVDPPSAYRQEPVDTPVETVKPVANKVFTAEVNDFSSLAVAGEYGPTTAQDSLWAVAEKVNQYSDVSSEQMMMALYKANRRAFYKPNVNALMAGKTLKIPKKADIVHLSEQAAQAQYRQQMAVWSGQAPESIAKPSKSDHSTQLRLEPPKEEAINHSDYLSANAEDQTALKSENQQLQERLANLEKQFALMQEMLAIRNQQLATLQNAQVPGQNSAQAPAPESLNTEPTAVPVEAPAALPEQATATEPQSVSSPDKPVTEPDAVAATPVAEPVKTVTPPVRAQQVDQQQAIEPVEDDVNYYYLAGGAAGAALFGWLGMLVWRRRQVEREDKFSASSMFAASSEIILPKSDRELNTSLTDVSSAYHVADVSESSFLSEFSQSDLGSFDVDQAEVDPSSEADVYLAYGRYQQAEELMQHAIGEAPNNDDYKLKLLEIFYSSENLDGFKAYAQELKAQGKNSNLSFWDKVSEMGKEMMPDSDLFASGASESTFAAQQGEVSPSKLSVAPAASKPTQAKAVSDELDDDRNHADIDFDLSSFSLMDDDSAETKAEVDQSEDIASIDFDLSSFELLDSPEESSADDIETLDFDRLESIDADAEEQSLAGSAPQDDTLVLDEDEDDDISLADFDFDAPVAHKSAVGQSNVTSTPLSLSDQHDAEIETVSFDDEPDTVLDLSEDHTLDTELQLDAVAQDTRLSADHSEDISLEEFEFDFDFDTPSDSQVAAKLEPVESLGDSDELKFDVDFDVASDNQAAAPQVQEVAPAKRSDEFAFDLEAIKPPAQDLHEPSEDDFEFENFSVEDLTDMDEFETKIDLAKAYMDMGDLLAAKEIAQEVIAKGNAEQQQEAKKLLAKLS